MCEHRVRFRLCWHKVSRRVTLTRWHRWRCLLFYAFLPSTSSSRLRSLFLSPLYERERQAGSLPLSLSLCSSPWEVYQKCRANKRSFFSSLLRLFLLSFPWRTSFFPAPTHSLIWTFPEAFFCFLFMVHFGLRCSPCSSVFQALPASRSLLLCSLLSRVQLYHVLLKLRCRKPMGRRECLSLFSLFHFVKSATATRAEKYIFITKRHGSEVLLCSLWLLKTLYLSLATRDVNLTFLPLFLSLSVLTINGEASK